MKRIIKHPVSLLLVISLALLFYFFGNVIVSPGKYFFAGGGDGIKNYYTPAWFVKYDSGNHFSGMNYPFGEAVTYTDNQPLISWILQFISRHIISISGEGVIGILNLLMIFSFIPTILLLFLILRHYKLPDWYAILFSLIIGFFSPQLQRWGGHYSLSYMFFFPLTWWLVIHCFRRGGSILSWALLTACVTAFGFIHLYYLFISCSFILLYSILSAVLKTSDWKKCVTGLAAAFVPLIINLMYSYITDPSKDRVETPWGFFYYISSFKSIFLPNGEDFFRVPGNFPSTAEAKWEGIAYVGIPGLFVLIFLIIRLLRSGFKRKWKKILQPVMHEKLLVSLWTAIFLLLYSMALPFRGHLEWLVDYLSYLKQFRSLGRFAWVFYYVFSVYSVYYLFMIYRMLRMHRLRAFAASFIILLLTLSSFDVVTRLTHYRSILYGDKTADNFFADDNYSKWLKASGYSPNEFQAILPLPFFNIGSEKILVNNGASAYEAFKSSFNTGLPIATCMMSRTSVSQAMKTAQLLADSLIEKQVLKDYPNKKPLLVVSTKEQLSPSEEFIISKSKKIFENDFIKMFLLPLENLKPDYSFVRNYKATLDEEKNLPVETDSSDNLIIQNSFENLQSEFVFAGKGANYLEQGTIPLYKGEMDESLVGVTQEFSVWVKVFKESESMPVLWYRQFDSSGNMIEEKDLSPGYSFDIIGDWIRIPCLFTLREKNNVVEFYFEGNKIALDELLIRPAGVNVICNKRSDGSFFFNNIPVPADNKATY